MKKETNSFTLFLFPIISLITVLILMGGSCSSSKENKTADLPLEIEKNGIFEFESEITLTKTAFKEVYPNIQAILGEVFGGAKLTGFLESMEAIEGGETAEYILKRKTTIQDLNLLLEAFSQKGYKTEFSVQEEGVVSFGVYNTIFNFAASYEIGDQNITILINQAD